MRGINKMMMNKIMAEAYKAINTPLKDSVYEKYQDSQCAPLLYTYLCTTSIMRKFIKENKFKLTFRVYSGKSYKFRAGYYVIKTHEEIEFKGAIKLTGIKYLK